MGETAWVPEASLIPVSGSPPGFGEIEALLAPVVVHVSVDDPPSVIVDGFALKEPITGGSTTVTVAVAVAAGATPVFLPARAETGFLPDLAALSAETLERTALFYLCTPGNPQGAIADLDYLREALRLARQGRGRRAPPEDPACPAPRTPRKKE